MSNRIKGTVDVQVIGDEPRHHDLVESLSKKMLDLIEEEFQPLEESDDWHPSEAAMCAVRALNVLVTSMVDMYARNIRDSDGGKPALTESEYRELLDDQREVVQKHVDRISAHLHNSN